MKKIVFIVAILIGLALNVNADTAIDKQINSTQQFVVVGTPTYNGYRFLAQTEDEDYGDKDAAIATRAADVCKLMGLGTPMVYRATQNAKTNKEVDYYTLMYVLEDGNLVLKSYSNVYRNRDWGNIFGFSRFIDGLSCKKK